MKRSDLPPTEHGDFEQSLRRHYLRVADPTYSDERLGTIVTRTAVRQPRPAWLVALRGQMQASQAPRSLGWRRMTWLPVAFVAIAAMAALIAGGQPSVRLESTDGPYDAVFVTGTGDSADPPPELEVVAVRADGQERTIARIPRSSLPGEEGTVAGPQVSPDGWLAFRVGRSDRWWVFVDLRSPQRPMRVVEIRSWGPWPSGASGAWGPSGTFVGSASEYHDVFYAIDVASGRVTEVEGIGVDAASDSPIDPRMLGPGGTVYTGLGLEVAWLLPDDTLDGGIAAFRTSHGPRRVRPDGTLLEMCRLGGPECRHGDPHDGATVTLRHRDGRLTVQYRDELLPDRAIDASFSADGSMIWLLLERGEGGIGPVLGRIGASGRVAVVRTIDDEPSAWSWPGSPSIAGMAPDDSFMLINAPLDVDRRTLMVSTTAAGPPSTFHRGALAGFVPSAIADTLVSIADAAADWPEGSPSAGDAGRGGSVGGPIPGPTASHGLDAR